MARLFISAAHKSSGKTTCTIGLCAALAARGKYVQPFKKGPDYIDPMWLSRAAKHSCYNLDFNTMTHEEIQSLFVFHERQADIAIIEGNKGLYDGLDVEGSNSNAALAKLLHAPVVLVLDARGMTRGIAPLIQGYQQFDRDVHIVGVILNQLGGHRHEQKLRQVIEYYTDVKVIGAVQYDEEMAILERHLGLIPSNEAAEVETKIQNVAQRIASQTNLDLLLDFAKNTPALSIPQTPSGKSAMFKGIKIGVARDAAFGFYYMDDLEQFAHHGAELQFFDTLHDTQLPEVDGLFIGGGFPETHMQALEQNQSMRESISRAIENGMPAYAECGGLMYLSRSIRWREKTHKMVGIIQGDVVMHQRPQGRGYVQMTPNQLVPWSASETRDSTISAHEFHYSSIENLPENTPFVYNIKRGAGIDGRHDGLIYKNVLASYTHLRHTRHSPWVTRFLHFVQSCKTAQQKVSQR